MVVRVVVLALAVVLAACGAGRQVARAPTPTREAAPSAGTTTPTPPTERTTPSPAAKRSAASETARPVGTLPVAASPTARATLLPDPNAPILTAVAEGQATATVLPLPTPAPRPARGERALARELRRFEGRMREAIEKLTVLPGWEYTVVDWGYAPGLALKARVAGPDRREWIVHEAVDESRVVARWVLLGRQAYSDISGRWERVPGVPFDLDSPIAFTSYPLTLYEPAGRATEFKATEAIRSDRPARLYYLNRELGDAAYDPQYAATTRLESLWVDEKDGYLLGYTGPSEFGDYYSPSREIDVKPLARPPKIDAPTVGAPAYRGAPPPWRAVVVGHTALGRLESYRFRTRESDALGYEETGEGQVGRSQARLRISITEPEADTEARVAPLSLQNASETMIDLVWRGREAWVRSPGEPWARARAPLGEEEPRDEAASFALSFIPGPPSPDLLRMQGDYAWVYDSDLGFQGVLGVALLTDARLVGRSTVNGVRTLHYRGSVNGGYADGPGDVHVHLAEDGLYLVRLRATFSSPPGPGDTIQEEDARSQFDVSRADEPFTVRPPR